MMEPFEYTNFAKGEWQELIAKFMISTKSLKRKWGFDFDDLLIKTVVLFKEVLKFSKSGKIL